MYIIFSLYLTLAHYEHINFYKMWGDKAILFSFFYINNYNPIDLYV